MEGRIKPRPHFQRFPKDRYRTEVESWRELQSQNITERPHLTAHNLTHQIADKLVTLYDSMSASENSIFKMPRLNPKEVNLGVGTSQGLQTSDQWGLGLIHIWRVNDIKQPKLRILILVLFRVGIVLLTVPAIVTFLQVTILPMKHLLMRILYGVISGRGWKRRFDDFAATRAPACYP